MHTIYKLTSPSNKVYIGYTSMEFEKRLKLHHSNFRSWQRNGKRAACTKLFYAFAKYGFENFTHEILHEFEDKQEASNKEIELIEQLDTIANGYNILKGGQVGRAGIKSSDEHKKRISEARKAYFETEEGLAWKQELAQAMTDRKLSYKGMEPRVKQHSDETKRKISALKKGIPNPHGPLSEETKRKIGNSNRGKKRTEEQRKAQSTRQKGSKRPESQKRAVAAALSKTWRITDPDGNVMIITNLTEFCRERGLGQANMVSVSTGRLKHHKKYHCERLS